MSERDAIFRELAERIVRRPIEMPVEEMDKHEDVPTSEQWQLISFQVTEFLRKRLIEGIKGCEDNALVKSIAESMIVEEYQLFSDDIQFDDKNPVDRLLNEVTLYFRTILKEQGYKTDGAFVTKIGLTTTFLGKEPLCEVICKKNQARKFVPCRYC
jgi:hypothetical protein